MSVKHFSFVCSCSSLLCFSAILSLCFSLSADKTYVNFKIAELITPLHAHFSAYYSDTLYIFGGRIGSEYNYNIFTLDVGALSIVPGDTDITVSGSASWIEAVLSPPNFGDSMDGSMFCHSQCSAVVGKYVYIFGPGSSTTVASNYVYRFDLSSLTFANENSTAYISDLPSAMAISNGLEGVCVTFYDDIIYVMGGKLGGTISTVFYKYDISNIVWTQLSDNNYGRQDAQCTVNNQGTEVYMLGGSNLIKFAYGTDSIDIYSVSDNSWDDDGFYSNPVQFSTKSYVMAYPRYSGHCAMNPFETTVYCPSTNGIYNSLAAIVPKVERFYPSTITFQSNASDVYLSVHEYGFTTYALTPLASLSIITGGIISGEDTDTNTTQYHVIFKYPTIAPTRNPTLSPTTSYPTEMPIHDPTGSPSIPPSYPPSTSSPTAQPITNAPTSPPSTGSPTMPTMPTVAVDKASTFSATVAVFRCLITFFVVFVFVWQ